MRSAPQSTGRRFKFVDVPLSRTERARLWHENLRAAINWVAPKTRSEMVEIPKDSPEYAGAMLEEVIQWINFPPGNVGE